MTKSLLTFVLSAVLLIGSALPALANNTNDVTTLASNTSSNQIAVNANANKANANDLKTDTNTKKQKVSIEVMLMLYKVIPTQEQPIF